MALILLVVALLLFEAKRIPDLARSPGDGARELRKGVSDRDEHYEVRENKGHAEPPEVEEACNEADGTSPNGGPGRYWCSASARRDLARQAPRSLIFGYGKLLGMAQDLGEFARRTLRSMDEFESGLDFAEYREEPEETQNEEFAKDREEGFVEESNEEPAVEHKLDSWQRLPQAVI